MSPEQESQDAVFDDLNRVVDYSAAAAAPAQPSEPYVSKGLLPVGGMSGLLSPATTDDVTALIEGLGLGYHLGSALALIAKAPEAGRDAVDPLRQAVNLISRYIDLIENRPIGADIHREQARLAEFDSTIEHLRSLIVEREKP